MLNLYFKMNKYFFMRNWMLLGLLLALGFQAQAQNQGIDFFKGSWQEALEAAKQQHKLIFVDAYTTWCGPCKKMSKEVFPVDKIGQFYNQHFINVKLDMEKGEGPAFAQKYRVTAYPTLLFIDAKGETVQIARGSRTVNQFLELGKSVLANNNKADEYAERYEEGERAPDFLRAYAYELLKAPESALKIANEYVRSQEGQLGTEDNLTFIYDFSLQADSRLFELLLEHQAAIVELKGEEDFLKKVEQACNATVEKAIEFKAESLVEEAVSKMKSVQPKYAKEYGLLKEMDFCLGCGDLERFAKVTTKYVRKFVGDDAEQLHRYAALFAKHLESDKALQEAEKWAKKAVELQPSPRFYQTYSYILRINGKEDASKKAMEKVLKRH